MSVEGKGLTSRELKELGALLRVAKKAARRYRELTKRPLGITGEIAEFEAARLLSLKLCPARQNCHDALGTGRKQGLRYQIKGRVVLPDSKPGQRVPSIRGMRGWDLALLVLLDQDYEPTHIYEATRQAILKALRRPGSRARNERRSLGIPAFKRIATLLWDRRIHKS